MYNSNTYIGYKLAFYRYKYDLDMYNNCTSWRKLINQHNFSDDPLAIVRDDQLAIVRDDQLAIVRDDQLAIVSNLSTLIDIRYNNNSSIDGLTINDIDILIE